MSGAPTRLTRTTRSAGPGRSTLPTSGPRKWRRTLAARATAWPCAWPARIKDKGGIRNQFHHVIDIVPTILEAAGLPEPAMVNGIAQKPIEGTSMVYTWDKANAPDQRTTQYFEMFGSRAIYHDGWIASAPPGDYALGYHDDWCHQGRDERVQVGVVRPRTKTGRSPMTSRRRCRTSCATCSRSSPWKRRSTMCSRSTTPASRDSSARNQATRRAGPCSLIQAS